jgi:hypothetical protein
VLQPNVYFVLQLGFLLIALIWQYDFSPFMVLIIAILNDGMYYCFFPNSIIVYASLLKISPSFRFCRYYHDHL